MQNEGGQSLLEVVLRSNQKLSVRIQQEQLDGRGEDEDGEL